MVFLLNLTFQTQLKTESNGNLLNKRHAGSQSTASSCRIKGLRQVISMEEMAAHRVEVNLVRLLCRCEEIASEEKKNNWRLDKYLNTLNDYLSEVRKLSTNQPSTEQLSEYTRRIELLSGIINAEKLPTSSEKCVAIDLLVPSKFPNSTSSGTRDLRIQTKARYQKDAREELLGSSDADSDGGLRRRIGGTAGGQEEDVDTLLRHHNQMHEKLAEEMVFLAQSLKENVKAAGKIVRDDKEKIVDSTRLADTNHEKLKVESSRLEMHVQRACSWWIWIMLVMVIATFIWMVIFMKLFPKR